MSIAIIGSGGQLGAELCRLLGDEALALSHERLDITDRALVRDVLAQLRPTAVVNTAAYTAVDRAEKEADLCRAVNVTAVGHLADACAEIDCPLVHVSTDYVFGDSEPRSKPYREDDATAPQGVYARTKFAGELAAAKHEQYFIVRTCGLYGKSHERHSNFVDTMLRLGRERDLLRIVDDQHCTPSSVADVARAIQFLLTTRAFGLYHVVNGGETTWHDFAAEIFRCAGINIALERITTAQYNAPAPRPSYSVLDAAKYHALGGPRMPHWTTALSVYLQASGASAT